VLFTIAEDLRKMQVNTNVAEGDVGRLQTGMEAYFSVDAFPGQVFRGKISTIRNAAQTLQNVVTYDAVIDVDNSDLRLRPGMTANVTIVYDQRDNALSVTNAALRFRPPPMLSASAPAAAEAPAAPGRRGKKDKGDASSEDRTVWVLRGSVPEQVSIKTGLSDGTVTEVVSGAVKEGDPLVIDATVNATAAAPATTSPATPGRRIF
jgi:HlyD family secretion protein